MSPSSGADQSVFADPVDRDHGAILHAGNAFTESAARAHPDRLLAFIGVNPVTPTALPELARWKGNPFVTGVKLHLTNSGVDLRNPDHARRLAAVFRAAATNHFAIAIHLYFDLAGVWDQESTTADLATLVALIRRIGLQQFLPASDWPFSAGLAAHYGKTYPRLALSRAEWSVIRSNLAPYVPALEGREGQGAFRAHPSRLIALTNRRPRCRGLEMSHGVPWRALTDPVVTR